MIAACTTPACVLPVLLTFALAGCGDSTPWHWHFVSGQWTLTEFAIELCDGNAELVNQDIDYWVDTVGQFCPWGSYAAQEEL